MDDLEREIEKILQKHTKSIEKIYDYTHGKYESFRIYIEDGKLRLEYILKKTFGDFLKDEVEYILLRHNEIPFSEKEIKILDEFVKGKIT